MENTKNIILLLAGGKGCRMHNNLPKQFIEVCGKPLIAFTMLAFSQLEEIDEIYVVCDPTWQDYVKETATREQIHKFAGCFSSGTTSMMSLRNGILGLKEKEIPENARILTHDSVRPLISREVILENIRICQEYGNAITAIQSNEAYMVSKDRIHSEGLIDRELLFRAQTPQTFPLHKLLQTVEEIEEEVFNQAQSLYTLMAAHGKDPLHIASGSTYNFKVTVPEDIEMVQALLHWKQ